LVSFRAPAIPPIPASNGAARSSSV